MINIDGLIDFDDMPLCPLCDQPIFAHEEVEIVTAINTVALSHKCCALDALKDGE